MEDNQHDWSSLPLDIVHKIAELLHLPNRVCFRMVCKYLHTIIPPISIPSPWLLRPGDGPEHEEYTDSLQFYCIATKTTFRVPLPSGLSGMHCVASQDGWLIMCDLYLLLCLVNPMTGVRIDLPPFSSFPNFIFKYEGSVPSGFWDPRLGSRGGIQRLDRKKCYIRKIVFFSSLKSSDFVVVALSRGGKISYTGAGLTKWVGFGEVTMLETVLDVAYNGVDEFIALVPNGGLVLINISGSSWELHKLDMQGYTLFNTSKFLAYSSDKQLYMIIRNGASLQSKFRTRNLTVMRLEYGLVKDLWLPLWIPVHDLDGHSLCVGNNHGFFLLDKDSPRLRGNCVYLSGKLEMTDDPYDMGVNDFGEDKFELLYPADSELNWPQPPAVWFKPSMKSSNNVLQ